MKKLGSNHKTAAAWNRCLAIRLLRQHGELSRHDISRMTQLQGSTLSYIMRELLERNIVRVVGKRQSKQVGPKQVLMTLNPDLGWVIGASLRPDYATLVMLDAAGTRIDGRQIPIQGSLEAFPSQLYEATMRWSKERNLSFNRLLAVGVGVPGVVDADSGVVLRSIPFNAVNLSLRQSLTDRFGVTTQIDHDACYGAASEATDGAAADASHFIFFSVNLANTQGKTGVAAYGSALYLNGSIYRGAFYGAGELSAGLEPQSMQLSKAELGALADPEGAMPIGLIELARRFGVALGPMVNLVDVQMVILAGSLRIANRRFIAAVQAELTNQLVAIPGRAVRVVRSAWEPEASARGAAIGAFDHLINEGCLFEDEERPTARLGRPAALDSRQSV